MYKLNKPVIAGKPSQAVTNLETGENIPLNAPDNSDYQTYLKWVAEGNTPLPADE
jgi:hypothetical protein